LKALYKHLFTGLSKYRKKPEESCHDWGSNCPPPEYKSQALQLLKSMLAMMCSPVHVGRFYNSQMREKAAKNSRLLECDAVLLGEHAVFQRIRAPSC